MGDIMAPRDRAGHFPWPGLGLLGDLRWRLRRYLAYRRCIANHWHVEVENEVPNRRTGTLVRVAWCRACSHVRWID